jgi:hypothetical protein
VITALKKYFGELSIEIGDAWNRFWFTPTPATTLGAIRVAVGLMSLYTIATYAPDLERWFSPDGMLPAALIQELFRAPPDAPLLERFGQWSMFDYLPPGWLWPAYWLSLVVLALYTLGVGGRTVAISAVVIVLSYFSRVPPTTGEYEIILAILLVYLCIGRAGDAFFVPRPHASRLTPHASPANTISLRLIQIHLAAVHLLMGCAQLAAPESSWWSGEGIWLAAMRPGMAVVDFSFLREHPRIVGAWSHVITLYLLAQPVLVWNRLTRPLVLAVGVFVWVSVALASGWVMFCLAMLTGLAAYLDPLSISDRLAGRAGGANPSRAV